MRITKQIRRDAKALYRSCLVNGVLDEERVRLAVRRVAELRPRGATALLKFFYRLVKLDIERRTARIESAVAVPSGVQERLQSGLTRRYGQGLRFYFGENPGLIGGLRVRVGSDVYDGSIRARLEALRAQF